jgi:1,2-diacylglycerol 3-alpha-glucosyltransferase
MRIGLFTDSYRPAITGITYVVDITRKHLEELGHEVFIFCASDGMRPDRSDDHVIQFRSVSDVFYEDYGLALFFPARELVKVKKLNLDVIQFFTPGQVGLMGIYAAQKTGAVLVGSNNTDLAHYIQHYPGVVPGLLVLALGFPMTFRFKGKDVKELLKIYRPRRAMSKWGKDIIESLMSMVYSRCDAVLALSPKSQKQLEGWQAHYKYSFNIKLLPTGIDAFKKPTKTQLAAFRQTYGIAESDEVAIYVGRLAAEKNLSMLIPVIRRVLKTRPKARLLFVGDFEYRATLEQQAAKSGVGDRITFTGALPRETLGVAYAAGDVFVFPSMTDTQGLVLNEAAHAGLPFVITDPAVTLVVKDKVNGLVARNTVVDFANKVTELLKSPATREKYGQESKRLASQYTEYLQTKRLEDIYKESLR